MMIKNRIMISLLILIVLGVQVAWCEEASRRIILREGRVRSNTAFFDAVISGDKEKVKKLIESDPKLINVVESKEPQDARILDDSFLGSRDPWNSLMYASFYGDRDILKLLLQKGAKPKADCQSGWTALHSAVWNGHADIVRVLLNLGTDPNKMLRRTYFSSKSGEFMSYYSESEGKWTVSVGGDMDRWTPLHIAARNGHTNTAQLLIENGAKIQVFDHDGWTPLHFAVGYDRIPIIDLLLSKGADVNVYRPGKVSPLFCAVGQGKRTAFLRLVSAGADLTYRNASGDTLLHWTTDPWIAETLISRGLNTSIRNRYQQTPLHKAAGSGLVPVAEVIVASGGDVDAQDEWGSTPLHIAVNREKIDMVKFLLEKGANTKIKDGNGRTPLDWAECCPRCKELVDILRKQDR